MSEPFDSRLTPARPDLAAKSLAGQVRADRYAEAVRHRVVAEAAPVRDAPDLSRPRLTEALYGEEMEVYEIKDGWAWGQLVLDGYVGWVEADRLGFDDGPLASHMVSVPLTHCYAEPDNVRIPILLQLSCESRLALDPARDGWCQMRTARKGWVYAAHTRPIQEFVPDFVTVAQSYLHAPYVWGGRQMTGLDCSALVQLSLAAAGIPAPRDTDLQEKELGFSLPIPLTPDGHFEGLQRGDLIFWTGHVGIMTGPGELLHANAYHMAVMHEPLAEAVARILVSDGPVHSVRRLSALSAES